MIDGQLVEVDFSDAEMFEDAIFGGQLHPCQLSKKPSRSKLVRVFLEAGCLGVVSAGPQMLYEGVMPADCYTLSLVLRSPRPAHSFNFGLDFTAGWLGMFPPSGVLDSANSAGSINAILTIPVAVFERDVMRHFPEMSASILRHGGGWDLGAESFVQLQALIRLLVDAAHAPKGNKLLAAYGRQLLPNLLRALRQRLADEGDRRASISINRAVADNGEPNGSTSGRARGTRRYERLRRVRDFVHDHLAENVNVSDLCVSSGLSERGLENLFKDLLGVTPSVFLRHQRLHRARQLLLGAEPDVGMVKAAAYASGFLHQGRFAHYYCGLFGEMPAQTLSRHSA